MNKFLKEPLLHFLLIGFLFFVIYGFVNETISNRDSIVFDDDDVNRIMASFEMQWNREPTQEELEGMINQNIRQEVFYQEALKMNLDHNDEIIKRRLAQKMQFLSDDLAAMKKASDEELLDFYMENQEDYMAPYSYSLYQIVFNPDQRKEPKKDAEKVLELYGNVRPDKMKNKGDKLPFPFYFEGTDSQVLARQLGSIFSESIAEIEVNKWVGPITSGFGEHLVFITEKQTPSLIDFDLVRNKVLVDFDYDNEQKVNESIYQELKSKYQIDLSITSDDFDPDYVKLLNEQINN